MNPNQVAQVIKMGRGFAVTRNSATLATTDYERVANEIADALNKRHAYPKMVEMLNDIHHFLRNGTPIHPGALIFSEDEPCEVVIRNLLLELGALEERQS